MVIVNKSGRSSLYLSSMIRKLLSCAFENGDCSSVFHVEVCDLIHNVRAMQVDSNHFTAPYKKGKSFFEFSAWREGVEVGHTSVLVQ